MHVKIVTHKWHVMFEACVCMLHESYMKVTSRLNCMRMTHVLTPLGGGATIKEKFDFEYPEVTIGTFLDQIFLLQIKPSNGLKKSFPVS